MISTAVIRKLEKGNIFQPMTCRSVVCILSKVQISMDTYCIGYLSTNRLPVLQMYGLNMVHKVVLATVYHLSDLDILQFIHCGRNRGLVESTLGINRVKLTSHLQNCTIGTCIVIQHKWWTATAKHSFMHINFFLSWNVYIRTSHTAAHVLLKDE